MSKSSPQFEDFFKETANFSAEYSDACTKSGTLFFKGMEDMVGAVVSYVQTTAEKQAEYAKEFMSSKTVNEFAEVQNKAVQTSFDDFMSNATKISEMGVKLLTDSAEPINTHMSKAMKTANKKAA